MSPKEKVERDMNSIHRPGNITHGQSVSLNRNYDKNHGTNVTAIRKSAYRNEKKQNSIKKALDKHKK